VLEFQSALGGAKSSGAALLDGATPGRAADLVTRGKQALSKTGVRLSMSDMKMLTMRELNRRTASVLDAVESGETFELRRNGRAVGYITPTPPTPQRRPDWKSHFDWLRAQKNKNDVDTLSEFEHERKRQGARERELGNLK